MTHTHVHVHTYTHIYIPGPKLIWKSRAMWVRYSFLQKLVAIFCGPALKLILSFLFCWKANCIIFKVFSQNYMHSPLEGTLLVTDFGSWSGPTEGRGVQDAHIQNPNDTFLENEHTPFREHILSNEIHTEIKPLANWIFPPFASEFTFYETEPYA